MSTGKRGNSIEDELDRLHRDLSLKRLSPAWAKVEILLGLVAASSGLLTGTYGVIGIDRASSWLLLGASVVLQTLGIYLTLAGHRSHVYQSQNKMAAWLANRISQRDE